MGNKYAKIYRIWEKKNVPDRVGGGAKPGISGLVSAPGGHGDWGDLWRWRPWCAGGIPKRPAFAGEFYSCPGKERADAASGPGGAADRPPGRRGGKKRPGSRPARSLSTFSTFCAGTKGLAGEEDLLFEITETAKEEEENREIWRFAKQLREEGFRIAMDDYGMGRSEP